MSADPTRLTDGTDAPAELRSLLTNAREDVPSGSQLKRVATRLGPLLGGAAVGSAAGAVASGSGATAGATSGGVAVGVKVGVALVTVALVGGGALWMARNRTAPKPAAPVSQPAAPVAAPQHPPHQAPAPVAPPASDQNTPVAPATEAKAEQVAPAKTEHEKAEHEKAEPSEASLLQSAQSSLKSDPKRALALVQQHRRLYPHGALSQEREVIAIEALTRLGRSGEAKEKADDFKKRYPDSAHESKVGATVEGQ